jgi:biotin transport system substrate-specific component
MHSLALRRSNLAVWARVAGVALFAVATALSARVAIPLAFSPVPLTLQVLVVLLSGLVLGPRDGLIAQLVYLQAILLGAPLTAYGLAGPAAFVAPTAGYLLAFPVAAGVAGWVAQRGATYKPLWRALGSVAGLLSIYALGTLWLSNFVGGLQPALALGVLPFLGVDALKVVIATAAASASKR